MRALVASEDQREHVMVKTELAKGRQMSALGQKQTFAVHQPRSALPPIATDMPQNVMSVLPPKADVRSATMDVR
jgi:hypothetical protein